MMCDEYTWVGCGSRVMIHDGSRLVGHGGTYGHAQEGALFTYLADSKRLLNTISDWLRPSQDRHASELPTGCRNNGQYRLLSTNRQGILCSDTTSATQTLIQPQPYYSTTPYHITPPNLTTDTPQ
jgi:hypothetical protein